MQGSLVLISVGNTRTRFARAGSEAIEPSMVMPNSDLDALAESIAQMARALDTGDEPTCVLATVNRSVSDDLAKRLASRGTRVLKFGPDLAIPMANTLIDDSTVGQDRLLDAIGAYARSKQACVVVDAGTAITVDFVDGEGTFHGGAIGPGLTMMLHAMHDRTSALPEVLLTPESRAMLQRSDESDQPPQGGRPEPFGKDTASAMRVGVVSAARGMVHELVDKYAEYYEAYPRVVATGGDAALLFEHDPLVEVIVPDLTLIGMFEAIKLLEQIDAAENDEEETSDESGRRRSGGA